MDESVQNGVRRRLGGAHVLYKVDDGREDVRGRKVGRSECPPGLQKLNVFMHGY